MENNTPHSARARAGIAEHQIEAGHYNRKTGKPRMPTMPTKHETAILRRVARGWIAVSFAERDGRKVSKYAYDDGTVIRDVKGRDLADLDRFIRHGWVVAVPGEALFEGGPAQRYVLPKP